MIFKTFKLTLKFQMLMNAVRIHAEMVVHAMIMSMNTIVPASLATQE